MFSFFKKNPTQELQKQYAAIMEKAMQVQRSGDLKAYAKLIDESEEILKKIDTLKS